MALADLESATAVILAGGLGSRLAEETSTRPKPMVEIGGKPILWHIMKNFSVFGIKKFIICLGYKGYMIKEYFANYVLHISDVTIDIGNNSIQLIDVEKSEDWQITLIDTGLNAGTAERLLRIRQSLDQERPFLLTYGDGVGNINVQDLYNFHSENEQSVTLTAVIPPDRFGNLEISGNSVLKFSEKSSGPLSYINGGFFVVSPSVLDRIGNSDLSWEIDVLPKIAREQELNAFLHNGFWMPMDTLRDKIHLEELWQKGDAPWRMW